jgi:hypothetical protein
VLTDFTFNFCRVEPTFICDGANVEYITDITKNIFPIWFPQKVLIHSARVLHQTEPSPGNGGQFLIGVDPFRIGYRTAELGPGFEDGDNSRWTPIASLFSFENEPQERVRNRLLPIYFNRETDSLWVKYGAVGGSSEQISWEMSVTPYKQTPIFPQYYEPDTTIRFGEELTSESNGWNGYAVSLVIPADKVKGPFGPSTFSKFSAGFKSSLTESLVISAASIGLQASSGNPWDFASAPVTFTSGGNSSFTIAAGQKKASDTLTLSWAGENIVIRFLIGNNGSTSRAPYASSSSLIKYHKASASSADITSLTPTGFSTASNNNLVLNWLAAGQ